MRGVTWPRSRTAAGAEAAAQRAQQQQQTGGGRGGAAAGPTFTIAIPGQPFTVDAAVFNQSPENVAVEAVEIVPADEKNWNLRPIGTPANAIDAGKQVQYRFSATVPADAAFTRPYFTRPDEEQPYYDIVDKRYQTLPVAPYPLTAHVRGWPIAACCFRNRADGAGHRTNPGNRRRAESNAGGPCDFGDRIAARRERCRCRRKPSRSRARFIVM